MNNRITYIGLYAFSLYSLIMSLIFGIVVLLLVMLAMTLYLYCGEVSMPILLQGRSLEVLQLSIASMLDSIYLVRGLPAPAWVQNIRRPYEAMPELYKSLRILVPIEVKAVSLYKTAWQLHLFISNKKADVMFTSNTNLEIAWTLLPIFILVIIMLPSLVLLYAMDDVSIAFGNITIKVIGHQWYWTYQHINMSPKLMPVYFDITKQAFLGAQWLNSLRNI